MLLKRSSMAMWPSKSFMVRPQLDIQQATEPCPLGFCGQGTMAATACVPETPQTKARASTGGGRVGPKERALSEVQFRKACEEEAASPREGWREFSWKVLTGRLPMGTRTVQPEDTLLGISGSRGEEGCQAADGKPRRLCVESFRFPCTNF